MKEDAHKRVSEKSIINEVRECIQIHAKMNDARITHIHYATTMLQNGAKFKI